MREGDDIYATADVTFTQAALGATLSSPTLDGEEEVELAPGTQPGEIVVLHGRGMPILQGRGRGDQRRGPCPLHSHPTDAERTFSVHLGKNAFQCFHADCGVKGNVLDLWAVIHRLSPYDAALHLAETFRLALNREEEPVTGPSRPRPAAARSSAPATMGPARGSG